MSSLRLHCLVRSPPPYTPYEGQGHMAATLDIVQGCRKSIMPMWITLPNDANVSGGSHKTLLTREALHQINQIPNTFTTLTQQWPSKKSQHVLMSQFLPSRLFEHSCSSKVVATSSPVALSSIAHRSQRECRKVLTSCAVCWQTLRFTMLKDAQVVRRTWTWHRNRLFLPVCLEWHPTPFSSVEPESK